jgi:hypothetical protein
MRDYASELYEEEPVAQQRRNYASEVFGDAIPVHKPTKEDVVPVQRHYEPTGDISTITGKPEMEFTGRGGPGASARAHTRAGWVSNPIVEAQIYATERFPNLTPEERMKRYRYQDGEIIFKADDGKWYSESPDLAYQRLKKIIAQQPAYLPSEILGALGAYHGGFGTAFVGAATGEGIRKAVGNLVFKDEFEKEDLYRDLLFAGIIGAGGEVAGKVLAGTGRKLRPLTAGKKARRSAGLIGKEAAFIDFVEAARIQKLAKDKYGVDLFDAQTTESRRLIDRINIYADLPETSEMVQVAKRIQDEQAYHAADNFFQDISPTIDSLYAGQDISKVAQQTINKKVGQRLAKSKPFYDKAFAANTEIDITPHIQELDSIIAEKLQYGPIRKKLLGFRRMLFREIDGESTIEVPTDLVDSLGNPITKREIVAKKIRSPESRIKQLDELKKSVDTYLTPKVGDKPIDNETKRQIRKIKDNILADLDKANPDYAMARKVWGDDSKALQAVTNKTLLKRLADLDGENVVRASRQLFDAIGKSPEVMKKTRAMMYPENPKAWDAALRVYLEDTMDSIAKASSGETAKVFNAFWRRTTGTPRQAKFLREAMTPQQYKNLTDFTDILRRVGFIARKESTTATRQEIIKAEQEGLVRGLVVASFKPLVTKRKVTYEKLKGMFIAQNRRKTAQALLTPTSAKHLKRIKSVGIGTEKGLKALTTFMSLVYGNQFTEINDMMFQAHE